MPLVLTEEQEMLRESAHGFLEQKAPVSALRKLRDTNDPDGFDRGLWKEMAEMGWAGILIDEEHGGADFGFVGAGVLAASSVNPSRSCSTCRSAIFFEDRMRYPPFLETRRAERNLMEEIEPDG